jgi:putative SOS response-associated peptidase YedK
MSRMFWGRIPPWARDDKSTYSTINASAETVATLATYKEPFRHKRCIVPATGFYAPDKIHYTRPPFPWHYFQLGVVTA